MSLYCCDDVPDEGANADFFVAHYEEKDPFGRLWSLETGQKIEKPSLQEVVDMIIRHGEMLVDLKGEYTGIREMRKHVAWYTQGMPHSSQIRRRVNELTNIDELRSMVRTLLV